MKHRFHLLLFIFTSITLSAQTNVRAWYADGQVWIVWEASIPQPETYAVYAKPTAFTNTADASLVGRLFKEEYGPAALREQVDTSATYLIPNGNGGLYQLAENEALFVATPHQVGALYFAVVAWGQTAATPGVNRTNNPITFQYNPASDPVECHLQKTFISPFDSDYRCFAFYMWADGRQNQWENRPDFPVMANAAKNGMPSFFMISAPLDLDTSQPFPLTIWLHGGGGTARQSLAGSRQDIRLNPQKGILLAHNDDMFGYLLTFFNGFEGNSRHFGWRKNYDPFTGEPPTEPDTIVNYTQRRYRWIDEWLTRNFNIDTTRININGHSMGSRGTTTIAKVYPSHYASATFLNNGFEDLDPPALIDVAFGPTELDFPTNLKGYDGETIHYTHMMNLETRLSSERDLPLMRSFHGKNDTGGSNEWDAYVVNQYRAADSLGIGAQLNWSERSHGPDTGPDYNDHWINGNAYTQQTIVDDIAYEEQFFRSDVSYPAFFNHRLDTKNNDPGDGTPGTGAAGVGDDWGTWGGYHRWDWNDIVDQPDYWSATAWLESNAIFDNDNCPNDFLTSDLAVRKPRMFKPNTGETVYWLVRETGTNQVLQSGVTQVQADNLVVVEQLRTYKKSIGRVLIELSTVASSTNQVENKAFQMNLFPNPSAGAPTLSVHSPIAQPAMVQVSGMTGQVYSAEKPLFSGDNLLVFPELETMPAGVYIVSVGFNRGTTSLKWIKQ